MFYYIALKYGNFLLETLDTFPLLKDAYTQSRKLYENRISCYVLPVTYLESSSIAWITVVANVFWGPES
jgi:hypothetical protein